MLVKTKLVPNTFWNGNHNELWKMKSIGILITFLLAGQLTVWSQKEFKVFFYSNGQKSSEGFLEQGKPNGYWKNYYETGILKSEGNRKDFQLDSTWKFFELMVLFSSLSSTKRIWNSDWNASTIHWEGRKDLSLTSQMLRKVQPQNSFRRAE